MEELNKEPFFSICIPNFNYASYVGITIQSVLDQTFQDFEIVVADNASTDNSMEVVKSYQEKDKRISLYRNNMNVGFAPNLQKATEKAKGKYIILLSSDDMMYPDALDNYHRAIMEQGGGDDIVLHAGLDFVDPQGTAYMKHLKMESEKESYFFYKAFAINEHAAGTPSQDGSVIVLDTKTVLRESILRGKSPASFLTVCYSRKLWQEVEGYDLNYMFGPDTYFLYKILSRNPKLLYVRKTLFMYRVHPTNQNSLALKAGAIKQQVDKYIFTYTVDGKVLDQLGIKRHDIERSFIRIFCIRESIAALSEGLWLRAFKIYNFAWATYPKITIRTPYTYINAALLATGPLAKYILKAFKQKQPYSNA